MFVDAGTGQLVQIILKSSLGYQANKISDFLNKSVIIHRRIGGFALSFSVWFNTGDNGSWTHVAPGALHMCTL